MDKSIIKSVLNDSIINVKHNQFKSNINRVLREITDSKEEYETLKKSVWLFWKKAHSSPVEMLGLMDYNHKSYTSIGFEDNVPVKWEGVLEGITNGIYYSGHNHPGHRTCFQSLADFENILIMNEKYAYTIGRDGFMIVKNTHNELLSFDDLGYNVGDDYTGTKMLVDLKKNGLENESMELTVYNEIHHQMFNDFNNEYQEEIKKIADDSMVVNEEFGIEDIDYTKYTKEVEKLFQEYVSNNIHSYVDDLNKGFEKNNVTTMKVGYCGKYERKKDN